jgi:hypothetical protein
MYYKKEPKEQARFVVFFGSLTIHGVFDIN